MNQCCEKCVYSSPWGLCPCKCHKPEEEGHPTDTTLEGLLKEVVDLFGFDNKEGTYWHILTRVKEARQVGTLTIDDYQEVTDEDIQPILDFITKAYTLGQANGRKAERERAKEAINKFYELATVQLGVIEIVPVPDNGIRVVPLKNYYKSLEAFRDDIFKWLSNEKEGE